MPSCSLQLQGLDHAARTDVQTLDRRPRRGGGLQETPRKRALSARRCGVGPNSKFKFPLHGGTGEIYRRIAKYFAGKVKTGKQLAEIDPVRRQVSFADELATPTMC